MAGILHPGHHSAAILGVDAAIYATGPAAHLLATQAADLINVWDSTGRPHITDWTTALHIPALVDPPLYVPTTWRTGPPGPRAPGW